MRAEVAVVGGGIVGSLIAYVLRQGGLEVLLLDAELPGAATHASAGMLAPYPEGLSGEGLRWGEEGLERYPELVEALRHRTGVFIPAAFDGTWTLARSDAELEALGPTHPLPAWLQQVRGVRGGRRDPGGYVHPQRLREALWKAFRIMGGAVYRTEVTGYEADAGSVKLHTANGPLVADRLIIAAGAWSGRFGLAVRPVKGEALCFKADPPPAPVFAGDGYVLPRDEGVYMGATSREGWQAGVDLFGLRWLADYAHETFPQLAGAVFSGALWGYRPMASEPLVGPVTERVFAATGHGRNGVLWAPATARKAAAWLGVNWT